jgi:uncharacterized protein (TIGR00369 family)
MPPAEHLAEYQTLLALPFVRSYGFLVQSVGDGECTLRVPFQEAFERPGGVVPGPIYVTAADVAAWLAIKTKLGMDDESVTADLTSQFIRGVRRAAFTCTARTLRIGKRLIFLSAECHDEMNDIVANFAVTYIRRS